MEVAKSKPVKMKRPLWQRISLRLLRLVIFVYVAVVIVFTVFQAKLIFPGASSQGTQEAVVSPPPGAELVHLVAADKVPVAALFGKSLLANPESSPTFIYFYGNGMSLADSLGEFQQFRKLGVNVLAVEYEGYGMSGGSPSEQGCYAAAEAAYQWLLKREDIDTSRIIPAGWSLGGAVAIDLAAKHAGEHRIIAVVTFSTFTSMTDVGRFHYPVVPVSLLLVHRFDSLDKIAMLNVPLFIGHGRLDDIAPFRMSDELVAAAGRANLAVTRLTVDKAAHNDFFLVGEDAVNESLGKFLKQFQIAATAPADAHGSRK